MNGEGLIKATLNFFGLEKRPFRITPDTEFFFLSNSHRDALNHLSYGIHESMGFVLITGEVGVGKTLLARYFLEKREENLKTALILNPRLSEKALIYSITKDLGLNVPSYRSITTGKLIDFLMDSLLDYYRNGKRVAVIVDEAQNLSDRVMESLRLLSNLETRKEKLLTIALFGQPELEEKLKKPNLRQISQRILVRYRLLPLTEEEVEDYIHHRLLLAGSKGRVKFSDKAVREIYKVSGGIPRKINAIAELSLLAAFVDESFLVHHKHVDRALETLRGKERRGIIKRIRARLGI
jgi:general secretion pathway protein A